jgi:hypothetical protein
MAVVVIARRTAPGGRGGGGRGGPPRGPLTGFQVTRKFKGCSRLASEPVGTPSLSYQGADHGHAGDADSARDGVGF